MTAELTEVNAFTYRAGDETTGRVEYEFDHVLIGEVGDLPPKPDPAEIACWAWISPTALRTDMTDNPTKYTPWLAEVLEIATTAHHP